jgi:primosomal protein N' (replication factor Y)
VLSFARAQDYRAFFESEIAMRRALLFPPFCDILTLTVVSDNESDAFTAANKTLEKIKDFLSKDFTDVKLQIFGPFEAPVYKLNEKYRVRLVIKCKNNKRTRFLFRQTLKFFGDTMPKNILASIDINPTTL